MSEDPSEKLTSGHLPVTAFQHNDPTAMGVVDLDRSVVPSSPDGRGWDSSQRDGLLLVRLHDQPLAIVHIERNLADITDDELAAEIWRSAGTEIRRHVERFRCAEMPDDSLALVEGLRSPATGCPGGKPPEFATSVAVIISTAGREQQLEHCIRSLLAQRRAELEVVVVDNRPATGETLRAVEPIMAEDSRVRYVAEQRVGLSVARNRGVTETNAEMVVFTDDDVVADAGWLEWLIAPFAEPDVTVACGMVLPLELETEAQKRFEQYAGFSKGMRRRSYDLQSGPVPGRLLYPFVNGVIGVGNNMAFRRAEIIAGGGFDPALGAGSAAGSCEETWAFSQAILRGGRIVYEPRALCWHEHRKDGDALRDQIFGYGLGLGAVLTKALTHDLRFYAMAMRSLQIAIRLQLRKRVLGHNDKTEASNNQTIRPDELLRARREGIVRGPLRYAAGVARSHRLGLGHVIHEGPSVREREDHVDGTFTDGDREQARDG
ncbi:MAG TPA: glycosyltransferase [Solirubrobacteraceae bacterium]|jgi:GT2 family glycosyltransferase|nr:glycosyltransferase [Solirubrobacteraceae bacterium]